MSYLLAVDWGTTWTAAALNRSGSVEIAPLASHETLAPSLAHLDATGSWTYGETARRRGAADPVGLARHVKRRFADPTPLVIQGQPVGADAIAAGQIGWVLREITAREGGPPDGLCLTHPAPWSGIERARLREIGESLHPKIRLLSEPEAVAVHYGSQERVPDGAVVAIYDFGGGTFDATVLVRRGTGFEILGVPVGVGDLGGVDLDAAVLQLVVEDFGERWARLDGDDPSVRRGLERLRRDVTTAKESLSTELDVVIPVDLPGLGGEIRVTRSEVEERFRPLVEPTMTAMHRALASAGVSPKDLHAILLAGGSSRIPLVGEIIAQQIGRPVAIDVHPKLAVALGAARAMGAPAAPVAPAAPPVPPSRPRADRDGHVEVVDVGRPEQSHEALPVWLVGAVVLVLVGLVVAAVVLVWPEDDRGGDVVANQTTTTAGSSPSSTSQGSSDASGGPAVDLTLPSEDVGRATEVRAFLSDPLVSEFIREVHFSGEVPDEVCEDRLERLENQHFELLEGRIRTQDAFDDRLSGAPASITEQLTDLAAAAGSFLPLCAAGGRPQAELDQLQTAYAALSTTVDEIMAEGGLEPVFGGPQAQATSTSTA
jgi:actin-like ATPase involved in cell morphogenesis